MPSKVCRENFIPRWCEVVTLDNKKKIGNNQEFDHHFIEAIPLYRFEKEQQVDYLWEFLND